MKPPYGLSILEWLIINITTFIVAMLVVSAIAFFLLLLVVHLAGRVLR